VLLAVLSIGASVWQGLLVLEARDELLSTVDDRAKLGILQRYTRHSFNCNLFIHLSSWIVATAAFLGFRDKCLQALETSPRRVDDGVRKQ
jgi:hypothetical protein